MKRDAALLPLSRDHHQALSVALKLRRATPETAGDARATFLGYWHGHGQAHFRLEEEVLLPAYAGHGDPRHPLVARALCDHVEIRRRAGGVADESRSTIPDLHELGGRLADHVRLEERELFPLIEAAMPTAELADVASALDRATTCSRPKAADAG